MKIIPKYYKPRIGTVYYINNENRERELTIIGDVENGWRITDSVEIFIMEKEHLKEHFKNGTRKIVKY